MVSWFAARAHADALCTIPPMITQIKRWPRTYLADRSTVARFSLLSILIAARSAIVRESIFDSLDVHAYAKQYRAFVIDVWRRQWYFKTDSYNDG